MIEELNVYANGMNANAEVIGWLNTTGKKNIPKYNMQELEHIIDYLVSSAAPSRLQKMSFVDAKRKADEWSKAQQKKGRNLTDSADDIERFIKFKSGSCIVLLKTDKAYKREGFLMSHCLGGYSPKSDVLIYSYRDKDNMPHATFEVRKNDKEVIQIKGKGNGTIHPKYVSPILIFLKKLGMDIRPSDMVNLGYHHIDKCHLDYLRKSKAFEQIAIIGGEPYAY